MSTSSLGWFTRTFGATAGVIVALVTAFIIVPVILIGGCVGGCMLVGSTSPHGADASADETITVAPIAPITPTPPPTITTITTLPPVDMTTVGASIVEDGRVVIKDQRIDDVTINNGSVDILFHNRGESWKPNVTVRFYNAYGVQVARAQVRWIFNSLASGERKTENGILNDFEPAEMFEFSAIDNGPDFQAIKYAKCDYGN